MKLYEITALQAEMDREDDEECKRALQEMIKAELETKAVNIVKLIKNKESEELALDTEIKRLQEFKKTEENKLKKFKEYVVYNMQEMQLDKIPTVLGVLSIRKSTAIQVDESKLPESAFIIERKSKDKKELKEMGLTEEQGVEKVIRYNLNLK